MEFDNLDTHDKLMNAFLNEGDCEHLKRLVSFAASRRGKSIPRNLLDDVFQSGICSYLKAVQRGAQIRNAFGYFLCLCENQFMEDIRKRKTARTHLPMFAVMEPTEDGSEAERMEELDIVTEVISSLKATDRKVLEAIATAPTLEDAYRFSGLSYAAFTMRLSRARRKLRARLERRGVEAPPPDHRRRGPRRKRSS